MSNAFLEETMLGMTWQEIEQAVQAKAVVFLPLGVVEAHGPHLPLGTDIYCAFNHAVEIKKHWDEEGYSCIIAPPFYWGGTQAMTRQFPGTFTASEEHIVYALTDILESLDRFGFQNTVLLNDHGDSLHKRAIKRAIVLSNDKLSMRTYWPVYEDDVAHEGFDGSEDYLLRIPPFALERAFHISEMPVDEFDIHAGAFETALMQKIMPELVRDDKIDGLPPTLLKGEQKKLWNKGEAENKGLVPLGYVGDPAGSRHIQADMASVYLEYAKGLAEFFKQRK